MDESGAKSKIRDATHVSTELLVVADKAFFDLWYHLQITVFVIVINLADSRLLHFVFGSICGAETQTGPVNVLFLFLMDGALFYVLDDCVRFFGLQRYKIGVLQSDETFF